MSGELIQIMTKKTTKTSQNLSLIMGTANDVEISKNLISKLLQYNMKYEEITRVILSHSERAFLDARLITLQEYYDELKNTKQSEVTSFLSSIPEHELNTRAI